MTRQFVIFLISALSLLSCGEEVNLSVHDPNYPTVFRSLSYEKITEFRAAYAANNKYIKTSLNQFGFCGLYESNRDVESPPALELPTESEAIDIVKEFVIKNTHYTGIENPHELSFTKMHQDGALWHIKSSNQKIGTIEVLHSSIIFHIKNREIYNCFGNWFPGIYIPDKFNIGEVDAKSRLLNKEVIHLGWSGLYNVTISFQSLNESTAELVILPVKTEDKIELRVTWRIYIPSPVDYLIFVDVMTGEIAHEQPTVIS